LPVYEMIIHVKKIISKRLLSYYSEGETRLPNKKYISAHYLFIGSIVNYKSSTAVIFIDL
ncbi:TPA: hypothetical protein ACHKC9_001359, partial [Escherichia coli]